MHQHWLSKYSFVRLFISDSVILAVILVNAVAVFVSQFPALSTSERLFFEWIDYVCVVIFVVEAIAKIGIWGPAGYWSKGWNRFDFFVVVAAIPILLQPPSVSGDHLDAFLLAPLLRIGRFLRFARVMRLVPNANHIWMGLRRALSASVGVLMVLFGLNLILAMGANLLFGDRVPEYFGDPITSCYTLFKVFTVEGWYEVPDQLAASGAPASQVAFLRLYMMGSVLVGGILGLSLANAVFVDEMTMDNNQQLEKQVDELREDVRQLREDVLAAIQQHGRGAP